MEAQSLVQTLEDFLAISPNAVVVEDGQIIFNLQTAKYSITQGNRDNCVLHLWSEERNTVRRVIKMEQKNSVLRLTVQQFGKSKPHVVEICASSDRRTPAARNTERARFQRTFERVLLKHFARYEVIQLRST